MKGKEAKDLVLQLMRRDIERSGAAVLVDPRSRDPSDPAKFMLAGMPARVVWRFSGWHVPISLSWFRGLFSFPRVNRGEFYWYVFAIPAYGPFNEPHYFICDFYQMREWVIEFAAPKGDDHQDHKHWRADFRTFRHAPHESTAYFRWGDEPIDAYLSPARVIQLDNVAELASRERMVGVHTPGGESVAHRLLKHFVSKHPTMFGLSSEALATVEYPFRTGDQVDVMFENHGPKRAVIEVEVEGENELIVGIHQAIKYRSLAASDAGFPLVTPDVQAFLVAYETRYPRAMDLGKKYDVPLISVDRREVLIPA